MIVVSHVINILLICLASGELLWNAAPFLLSDVILVNVDVIAKRVQVAAEDKRRVHEAARVHEFAFLADLHLLDVQHEHAAEDLESDGALATKDQDLVVSDLVCEAHVARDPLGLVAIGLSDLLPDVLGDVIALDRVHNLTLIDSTAKCEDEIVLEAAQCYARTGDSETVNLLPLVLSDVVDLTEAINLTVDEGAYDVNEALK